MRRALFALFAAVVAVTGLGVPRAAADAASMRSNAPTIAALFDLHNQARQAEGLKPLVLVPAVIEKVSQPWTLRMAADGHISHNPDFYWPGATAWAENVGWVTGEAQPTQALVQGALKDPGHRANIMKPDYTHVAIGAVLDGGQLFATVNFYAGPLTNAGPAYATGKAWLDALTATPPPAPITPPPGKTPKSAEEIYTRPGTYTYNGRHWRTACQPYSKTSRCRTEIWATIATYDTTHGFRRVTGWAFNNLTYLASPRSLWAKNPLAIACDHVIDGRKWRTECETPRTGKKGCRSYIETLVVTATADGRGGWKYTAARQYIFNNIVRFT